MSFMYWSHSFTCCTEFLSRFLRQFWFSFSKGLENFSMWAGVLSFIHWKTGRVELFRFCLLNSVLKASQFCKFNDDYYSFVHCCS